MAMIPDLYSFLSVFLQYHGSAVESGWGDPVTNPGESYQIHKMETRGGKTPLPSPELRI